METNEKTCSPKSLEVQETGGLNANSESSPEPATLKQWIGTLAFWLFVAVSCVVMFIGALFVFLVTAPFDPKRHVLHLYSCFWGQLYFYVTPIWKLRIEGRERIPWRGAAVLISNHQSLGDILVLFGLYRPFKWVSKKSIFKVPFVGWNMRLNKYIPLVRGDRGSIRKMMNECRSWLDRGVPVLMFPEGTRSPDGNVLPFKDGAFRLAVEADCPVIPIALNGTAATLPKNGYMIRKKANCRVRVLPPIHPAEFGHDVAVFRDHIRDVVDTERRKLT